MMSREVELLVFHTLNSPDGISIDTISAPDSLMLRITSPKLLASGLSRSAPKRPSITTQLLLSLRCLEIGHDFIEIGVGKISFEEFLLVGAFSRKAIAADVKQEYDGIVSIFQKVVCSRERIGSFGAPVAKTTICVFSTQRVFTSLATSEVHDSRFRS